MGEMNEEEYQEYLRSVFGTREYDHERDPLQEQLTDEDGHRVPGCFRTVPANTE